MGRQKRRNLKLNIMKTIIFLILIAVLSSCATERCGNWKDVERFDRKPFRAENFPNYDRAILVKVYRGMNGHTHYFVKDNGDTIKKLYQVRLDVNECYLIRKS